MYVCMYVNVMVRVCTDGQKDRCTHANGLYNVSHTICYSYGAENNISEKHTTKILHRNKKIFLPPQRQCDQQVNAEKPVT